MHKEMEVNMKKCPNCGTKNADSALQCNFCDTKLDEEIKTESKSADYVHDEKTEKKRRLTGRILLVVVIVFIAVVSFCVGAILFADNAPTKAEEIYSVVSETFETNRKFSGSFSGNGTACTFNGEIKNSVITITLSGGKYETITFSKDGLMCNGALVDKSNELYNLYTSYLLITSTDKSLSEMKAEDIKNNILPIIKSNILSDFDERFNESTFVSSIHSLLAYFNNDDNVKSYFAPVFPDDIKNGETSFDIASYDLQNQVLKEFKNAFKSGEEYDSINTALKEAKSHVNKAYKMNGSFVTENGVVKSANLKMVNEGKSYFLSISFE